ncbi:MAG: hypothetical protein FWC33_02220 [Candidatus Bathyarchaeota archaeon]|nr:hypothetical protein [Candidatus Termiticorpusculum sp.]
MNEPEKCIECGSTNILNDPENGDTVCITCGLVLDNTQFAPPPEHLTKKEPTHIIAYTSAYIGTKTHHTQRTELNVAYDISLVIQKLDLPRYMERIAINYVRKLRRARKQQKNQKIRLTRTELTIVSIWVTIKKLNYPLSADEYLKKLQPLFKNQNLMKMEKRASQFIKPQNRFPNTNLITKHINKLTSTLENNHLIDNLYANKLGSYAIQIVLANPSIVSNRKANIVAASALLTADRLLAKRLRVNLLAEKANIGTGSLSKLAQTCKQHAPPLPPDGAAIQFSSYLLKEVKIC